MFSLELLQAISDWQRGGNPQQKARRGKALKKAIVNLPDRFQTINTNCYRQIALDKKSVWNLGTRYKLGETISSWTTSLDVAKGFKGGVPPEGYQGVIFKVSPIDKLTIIVNIQSLFQDEEFRKNIEFYKREIVGFNNGIGRYSDEQKEVVISTEYLNLETLYAWGGFSSSENVLAEMCYGYKPSDAEMVKFIDYIRNAKIECGPRWIERCEVVKRISYRLKIIGKELEKR